MDFSTKGLLEGIKKFGIVLLYVIASGALVGIADFVKSMEIDPSNYILVATVGLVNAFLAFAIKWLGTKK